MAYVSTSRAQSLARIGMASPDFELIIDRGEAPSLDNSHSKEQRQ
jgi:hypothetical protein